MNLLVLTRLLVRRSTVITLGVLALLAAMLLTMKHGSIKSDSENRPVQFYFSLGYAALTVGGLISFGGFIAKATSELENVRLCRTVPGLRRRINRSVLLMVPIVATCATGFIFLAVYGFEPEQAFPLWAASAFLFCLGFGLGWSWLLFVALALILAKLSWVLQALHAAPVLSSLVALGLSFVLLEIRHGRFLAPRRTLQPNIFSWLAGVFSIGATSRRAGDTLPDRPGWSDQGPSVAVQKLTRAGVHERLGHSPIGLLGRIILSTLFVYALFSAFIFLAWTGQNLLKLGEFTVRIFVQSQPDPVADAMRVVFAVTSGAVAFLCALLLDTTLRPDLWHPVSRRLLGRSIFISHLRQNLIFAVIQFSFSFIVVLGFHVFSETQLTTVAFGAFLAPTLVALMLMPIPQAMFPNGVETFRKKTDPQTQLLAGITGGTFSLLNSYWYWYWPTKRLHDLISPEWRIAGMVMTGIAIYAAYYAYLTLRYSRFDLRWRTA